MNEATSYNAYITQTVLDAERGLWNENTYTPNEAVLKFLDACLDLELQTTHTWSGARTISKVALLRTYGGPTTRITHTIDSPHQVEVRTVWGSQKAFCEIYAPLLVETMMEAAGYLLNGEDD